MLRRWRHWPQDFFALVLSERERWAYWGPVWIGMGVGSYFACPFEPWAGSGLLASLVLLVCWYRQRHQPLLVCFIVVLLCLTLGFAAAQVRTLQVKAPMLSRSLGPVEVVGIVLEREVMAAGGRIVLGDLQIERLPPERTPGRIRLTVRAEQAIPPVGAHIRVLANLLPPMEPAYPGGYDFRRAAFYQGLGAYGIALRPLVIVHDDGQASLAERWREAAASTITTVIPGAEGAIASALMTGERGAIDEQTNADMRAAGTAHLLSISGMHIGMVGGFVFYLIRALLAAVPVLALRHPIKRWAAVAALAVVVAYTWLVGAPIPAQRATLMAGLVFLAILLDRQAISMRSVALAAGVILLVFPEALLNPGFQMSFAAIVLLVAAYEWWHGRKREEGESVPGWGRRTLRYVAGIITTSLIAGLATMPYGAWHFHRLQLLGVLGNLIAVPLTGFVVMPAAVLAYPLLPLDLAGPVLMVMGWGLTGVTRSAAWIAGLPYANIVVGQFGLTSLLLITLGGLWLALWQTKLRQLGFLFILSGLLLMPFARWPVALVSAEGKVAVRGQDGLLYAARVPVRGLTFEQWQLAFNRGQPLRNWGKGGEGAGFRCDKLGCVAGGNIALPLARVAAVEDCRRAEVVIAPDLRLRDCAAPLVIDRRTLRDSGACMIYAGGRISCNRHGSLRPWSPDGATSYTSSAGRPDVPAP